VCVCVCVCVFCFLEFVPKRVLVWHLEQCTCIFNSNKQYTLAMPEGKAFGSNMKLEYAELLLAIVASKLPQTHKQ